MLAREKAPPKFIKAVNPAYIEFHNDPERDEEFISGIYSYHQAMRGLAVNSYHEMGRPDPFIVAEMARAEVMSWFPERYAARMPPEGAWILAVKPPHTEIQISRFSIWYALPDDRLRQNVGRTQHLAQILTPAGSLWLWPHEYRIIDIANYLPFEGEGYTLNFFSEASELRSDTLHYVMSRGIPRATALTLLLPALKSQTVCWLEADEELQTAFM